MIDEARKERLTRELAEAELALDALTRSMEPGKMRTQQAVAGQRAKVYSIRSELIRLEMRIKEAEQAARAASSQAADDEIGEMLRRLNQADSFATRVAGLH